MTATLTPAACDRDLATKITLSLLGYGVIAGPVYVTTSVLQGLARDGFSFTHHQWSLLANGPWGWIQTANLIGTGLMIILFGTGLHRNGAPAARLVAAMGLGMIGAGIFKADPGNGFPAGTPEGPGQVTLAGTLHLATSGVGFLCLAIACYLMARRFAPVYSRVTAIFFLAGFVVIATGGGAVWTNLVFTAAIIAIFTWTTTLALHEYRR
ncbi:DUF998 domain-containing protein [Spirillospora sp. NPDC047279]|uniref:DUF998 domain-containing protein n=1 Tax=Spirillospora sp. NPDC047279 TaxID=3155478 RepID=UPI0033DDD8F6